MKSEARLVSQHICTHSSTSPIREIAVFLVLPRASNYIAQFDPEETTRRDSSSRLGSFIRV